MQEVYTAIDAAPDVVVLLMLMTGAVGCAVGVLIGFLAGLGRGAEERGQLRAEAAELARQRWIFRAAFEEADGTAGRLWESVKTGGVGARN